MLQRQAITGVRQKASTAQNSITTTSRPQNLEDRPDHHEDILTFLYMGPLYYGEFCWFYNFYLYIQFDNMY
jgi:hypothetical protein